MKEEDEKGTLSALSDQTGNDVTGWNGMGCDRVGGKRERRGGEVVMCAG